MIEKWKHALCKGKRVGTVFMDLSKAFDTLNPNLLATKLNGYGFSFNAVKFVQSYLSERLQRIKIYIISVIGLKDTPGSATRVNSGSPFIQHFHSRHFI